MTTFSSSQQNQRQQKKQYQTSIGATMVNNTQLNQHDQPSSKGFTIQRPSLGLHQNGSLSALDSSPYYTTTRQTNLVTGGASSSSSASSPSPVSESGRTCSDSGGVTGEPGMTDDEDDYDEDDVEIIMHEGNGSFNSTDSGIDNDSTPPINSSPAAAAPCQHHRQQPSSDHDHQFLQEPTYQPLQRQLEFYFSRQNLASDTYLVSQMDPDLYVPIATIAKFKRVQDITSDLDYIVSTLRRSLAVTVDESGTKVKPNISLQRTTVILREMPDATEKEINHFLQDLNSPPVKNIKNEYGNMWYITFDSEEDALKLLYDTRGKLFKGQPVAARMKSEPVVGSIQARKSALQAESSASTTHTLANATLHGQDQHSSTIDTNNMKNNTYNSYYYAYNPSTSFRKQYPSQFSSRHGTSYSHYSPNGGQRTGKFINNTSNNPNVGNGINNHNSNSNTNRRSTRGGRGRHTPNSGGGYGSIGRNIPASTVSATTATPSTDTPPSASFVSYTSSDRPWTHRYNWQATPKSQRYRQTRSTPASEQVDITGSVNDTHDDDLAGMSTPPSSSPNSSLQSSQYPNNYKRHYYYQPSNYHRGQKNGKPHHQSTSTSSSSWQYRRYNNSSNTTNLQYHQAFDVNGLSTFTTRASSNRPTHYNQDSPLPANMAATTVSLKLSSSTPSHDMKFNSTSTTTVSSAYRKNSVTPSSSSSENTHATTITKAHVPTTNGHSSSSAVISTFSESAPPTQEDRKSQADLKAKRKAKWDKKKKTRKSSATDSVTDKPQEQPDLQSGTYFPPLPGTKDINSNTTAKTVTSFPNTSIASETLRAHEMTVSDLLEERLSAADIVKKGPDTTSKKSSSILQTNGSSVSSASTTTTTTTTNFTATGQQQKSLKDTPHTETNEKKSQQTSTSGKDESFPRLCPGQDSPMASTNFSYADMLKRKENGTK